MNRGEAAARARKETGLRTYLIEGEEMSPAGRLLESRLEVALLHGSSKRRCSYLAWLLTGCDRGRPIRRVWL